MEMWEKDGHLNQELYALLHLSPRASNDEIKQAYRQWAQIYHPDKHQTPQMQDIATENFQKIRDAYDVLSDERKRQIYDLYGLEGLTSGLELGLKLKSKEEVRAQFERLRQRKQERKLDAYVQHRGSFLMNLSLIPFLESYHIPNLNGMAMSTQVQAKVSKNDTLILGGNMVLKRGLGGGSVTMILRRQLSPISRIEIVTMVGLRSLLSLQTSRQLSSHSTGTLGLSVSLKDGSVTLANTWSRQLSEDTTGNIQLVVGPEMGISVGWQKHGEKNVGSADVKVGPTTVGVSCQFAHHFSCKSQGQLSGKIGSTGVEVELGGERRLSDHSSAAMLCVLGLQGISWKIRFTRGGQKFVIPIMLCAKINPFIAVGALVIPSSIYTILKTFVYKPYNLRRKKKKIIELRQATYTQVMEARASSEKSQLLLKSVAERKKQKQAQQKGLVILVAIYGDIKAYEQGTNCMDKSASTEDDNADLPPPYLDVAIPIQFLINDCGQLRLHKGVKKAGLMGFCDPCPSESKQLKVVYSYLGHHNEVIVGDYDELQIPQEVHKIQCFIPENVEQVPLSNSYCDNPLHEPNPRLISSEIKEEKLEQCIAVSSNELREEQSKIKELKFENRKKYDIQRIHNFHVKCKSTKVEGVKYVGHPIFANKKKKDSLEDGHFQRFYNFVSPNQKFNKTSDSQEVHKFLFIKEDVQSIVSHEEVHGVIIELVDSLYMALTQCQKQSLDKKPITKVIVEKQKSLILTYEDLTMAFHMGNFSNKNISLIEVVDKYNVLRGATTNSMSQNLDIWSNEAQNMGLGWVPIDNNATGFQVESIQAWLVALILIHESQCNIKLCNRVDFKFGIDAHTIKNSHIEIFEVMVELLYNPSPLSCISVANWKGKNQQWNDFFSYIAKTTDSKNILHQLGAVCEDGLKIDDRHLDVTFIECHHMAFYCSSLYRNQTNGFEKQFCPWCTISHQSQCIVTMDHNIAADDTIKALSSTYHMRPQLLVELNAFLENLHYEHKIHEFLPDLKSVIVFRHWPMNCNNIYKLTPGTMLNTYCACHALTQTISHMIRTLGMQAQQYDQLHKETQSQFMLLWQALTNPPLLIECEIDTQRPTNKEIKYDEFDEEIANHILNNHEKLFEVIEEIPTLEIFVYTKRMWGTYCCFNKLQQMSLSHSPTSQDESLVVVAREFLYYATKALGEDVTLYIHIQGAHADQFQYMLPYPIGRLKNSAMQRKHKLYNDISLVMCTNDGKTDFYNNKNMFGLDTEMIAQYVCLKMIAMPTLQELKKQIECWIPWSMRSFLHCHFKQLGYVAISIDEAEKLAEHLPTTTANQVFCLFKTWSEYYLKNRFENELLQLPEESFISESNLIQDGVDIELSNITQKNVVEENSYTCMKTQNKSGSCLKICNNEMNDYKIPISIGVLCMEEASHPNNCENLFNHCDTQVDPKCLNNESCETNETIHQEKHEVTNIDSECNFFLNSIINSILKNSFEGRILSNKDNNLHKQSLAISNIKTISNVEEAKQSIFREYYNLKQNIEYNQGIQERIPIEFHEINDNEVKVNFLYPLKDFALQTSIVDLYESKCQSFDVVDTEKSNNKQSLQRLKDEKLQEVLSSNVFKKINASEELSCSSNKCEDNKLTYTLDKSSNLTLEKPKNLQFQDYSSLILMVDLQGITTNVLTKNSESLIELNGGLNTKHEKFLDTKFHVEEHNVIKQDKKLEAYIFEKNLQDLQCFAKDSQSVLETAKGSDDDISRLTINENFEYINSKNLPQKNEIELNKILVNNVNKLKKDKKNYVDSKALDIEATKSDNIHQSCKKINKDTILNKKLHIIPQFKAKKINENNAIKSSTLKNIKELKNYAINCLDNLDPALTLETKEIMYSYLTNKSIIKQINNLECCSLLDENKKIDKHINNFESLLKSGKDKNFDDNDLCATHFHNKIIDNYNYVIYNGCESSLSQSHSLIPEDGGILKNKRYTNDDIMHNEKSFKLKSFERSLDSLFEKSRTFKKLYMKKTCTQYNSLKPSTPPPLHTLSTTSTKVRVPSPKVDTLYPCNPYPFSKEDFIKEKIERLHPYKPCYHKTHGFDKKKSNNKSNKTKLESIDYSTKHKFQRQHVSQPLCKMKKETMTISSPKQDLYLKPNGIQNNEKFHEIKKPESSLQCSKKCKFIKADNAFPEPKKLKSLHVEHESTENEIFVPFVFDDARFFMPNKHDGIQNSNASCDEEQERVSLNSKKKVTVNPNDYIILPSSLQCQQVPTWVAMADSKFVTQDDSGNFNYEGHRNQEPYYNEVVQICHHPLDTSVELRIKDIDLQTAPCKGTEKTKIMKNGHFVMKKKSEGEPSCVDEIHHKKEGYGKPCCCDPSKGHATTCYQYIPNYEPPEVTRIKKPTNLDNSMVYMNYKEQFTALKTAQFEQPDHGDLFEQPLHTFQKYKSHKYGLRKLHSCRMVDDGNANLEFRLKKRGNNDDYVEKGCEYDRIGRYRRSEFSKPKLRKQW